MTKSLIEYLQKQSEIYCACPVCTEIFRLNEARLTWGKVAETDLLDKMREQEEQFQQSISEQRADAIKRSRAVSLGKMLEHISPYFPSFKHNPRDARFIGNPIDYVLFKGVYEQRKVEEIVIAEIKTGSSRLTTTERSVKKAIDDGKVSFEEIHVETT